MAKRLKEFVGRLDPALMRQVPFRMHRDDAVVLKKLVKDDGLTVQGLVATMVEGYMKGNPHLLRYLRDQMELLKVPKDVLDRYSLSQRDREKVLAELDKELDGQDISEEPVL